MEVGMFRSFTRWPLIAGATLTFFLSPLVFATARNQTDPTPTVSAATTVAAPTAVPPVNVNAVSSVRFRPNGGSEIALQDGTRQGAYKDDTVNVDVGGEALLNFPRGLIVRVFRDSELKLQGYVDPSVPVLQRFFLQVGTLFGARSTQGQAEQKVLVETQGGATIREVGTRFFVHYDQQRQITWVVVDEGSVEFTAGGVSLIVQAGWQSWAVAGGQPEPPIPASRGVLGTRFPIVDTLTDNRLLDGEVLRNQQCAVIGSGLNTREGPTRESPVVDVLRQGERFEAMRRTSNGSWLYGITPRGIWGWAATSYLRCAYATRLLSFAPPPLPFAPLVSPTAVPSTTPSSTPTPTVESIPEPITPTRIPTSTPTPTASATPTAIPTAQAYPVPPLPPPYALEIQLPPALASMAPVPAINNTNALYWIPVVGILVLTLTLGERRRIYRDLRTYTSKLVVWLRNKAGR